MKYLVRLLICAVIFGFAIFSVCIAQKSQLVREEGVLRVRSNFYGPDTVMIYVDTVTIFLEKYTVIYRSDERKMYIVNSAGEILLQESGLSGDFNFVDFDDDGFKDIVVTYKTNAPGAKSLLLFNLKEKAFRRVEDFEQFLEPVLVTGSANYFYSYNRTGCADLDWRSDLFMIRDYKTVKTGSISVNQCPNSQEANGIFVRKLKEDKMQLVDELPLTVFETYTDGKWGFLEKYWESNYKKFRK